MLTKNVLLVLGTVLSATATSVQSCDTVETGYQCDDSITHWWGQYSPYFSVASDIPDEVPDSCDVTFVQLLERHGARFPTASKSAKYAAMVQQLQKGVQSTSLTGAYAFLANFTYSLGADDLTSFGAQQAVNSGAKLYRRYKTLADQLTPFVRASGEQRVVDSAGNWTEGFHAAKTGGCRTRSSRSSKKNPYPIKILHISEATGSNNTLDPSTCPAFEDGFDSTIGDSAQAAFAAVFVPAIQARINAGLPGADLTLIQTVYLMDMCPFETVASDSGAVSAFCALFTEAEWHSYDYYQTLGKFYAQGWGNPLGASQGVGFVNELIARLTQSADVLDHSSVNTTLDGSPATFPVGGDHQLFADFSHDNPMTSIFSALGLYNQTATLSNTIVAGPDQTHGYSAAWTVPFGGRAYIEKQACRTRKGVGEYVRIIVNDRVVPLQNCGADSLGRCRLDVFVDSLSYARSGGNWPQCYV